MKSFFSTPVRKSITAFLLIAVFVHVFALVPLNYKGEVQEAHALVVFDPKNAALNKVNIAVNTITQTLQNAFYIKEFTLDGIANGLAKMMVKSMTQSIVNWINSGFQGSPAFVTDLNQYLRDQVDLAIGDYIYNDPGLNFLCSPFQLDVKVALATTYQEEAYGGVGSKAQCTLSNVTDNVEGFLNGSFNEGGWGSWFELTQNPGNTPTGALLEAQTEMYARIVDEQGNEIQQLNWGDGFMSFKVCADTEAQKNCDITTPGRVIADQINKSLGAGQDALISADEINEIISALFAQLAQQAITGINGLLGLGSSSYSSGGFGTTGSQSYLDALRDETAATSTITDPFPDALENETLNISLQNEIISKINAIEQTYNSARAAYPSCVNFSFPDSLVSQRDDAQLRILVDQQHISELNIMHDQYQNSNLSTMNQLVNDLVQMQQNGELTGLAENDILRVEIDFTLTDEISTFRSKVSSAASRCQMLNNR